MQMTSPPANGDGSCKRESSVAKRAAISIVALLVLGVMATSPNRTGYVVLALLVPVLGGVGWHSPDRYVKSVAVFALVMIVLRFLFT
jgi:hypothetical protein